MFSIKVIQRRLDVSVDFYRNRESYEEGFGEVEGEYWLGKTNKKYRRSLRNFLIILYPIDIVYCIQILHLD